MIDPGQRACRDELHRAAVLPVAFVRREAEDAALIARRQRRNLAALAIDAAGDERRGERPPDETPGAAELARVESKLNAIMELFALVLERELALPRATSVRFNAFGAEWAGGESPAAGTPILVRIHLEACSALPLEFAATALEVPEPGWCAASFEGLKPALAEAVARMVFREHRRQVADFSGI
ncbi:MAG: PilZ domain-containing protein [Rhodanobacteraceae bacterium]